MTLPNNPLGPNPSLGAYVYATQTGTLYAGGNQAVVATAMTAGVPTTYTGGLVLANPPSNTGVSLVLQRVQVAFDVAQTNAAVISLGLGYSSTALTGTLTAITPQNQNPGSSNVATGKLYSSASITLPVAPFLARVIGSVDTGALTVAVNAASLALDLDGGVLLPPGGFACILSSATGTASSMIANFVWVEVGPG